MFFIGLIIGLFIGAILGIFIISLLSMNRLSKFDNKKD